jgi:hypothetical protein
MESPNHFTKNQKTNLVFTYKIAFFVSVCVLLFSSVSHAASVGNGVYTITNGASGMVLDDPGSAAPGAQVIQWWKNRGQNQNWVITYNTAQGAYTIVNQASGGYLTDVSGKLYENTASGGVNQLWNFSAAGSNYLIQNLGTAHAIDDPDSNTSAGTGMIT